MPDMISCNRAL